MPNFTGCITGPPTSSGNKSEFADPGEEESGGTGRTDQSHPKPDLRRLRGGFSRRHHPVPGGGRTRSSWLSGCLGRAGGGGRRVRGGSRLAARLPGALHLHFRRGWLALSVRTGRGGETGAGFRCSRGRRRRSFIGARRSNRAGWSRCRAGGCRRDAALGGCRSVRRRRVGCGSRRRGFRRRWLRGTRRGAGGWGGRGRRGLGLVPAGVRQANRSAQQALQHAVAFGTIGVFGAFGVGGLARITFALGSLGRWDSSRKYQYRPEGCRCRAAPESPMDTGPGTGRFGPVNNHSHRP